jgi:hypothetical protein
MASLLHTNPYLRSARLRERMLIRNALASSIFEGARGLRTQRRVPTLRVKALVKKRSSKS